MQSAIRTSCKVCLMQWGVGCTSYTPTLFAVFSFFYHSAAHTELIVRLRPLSAHWRLERQLHDCRHHWPRGRGHRCIKLWSCKL
jgi:hypothetical protein